MARQGWGPGTRAFAPLFFWGQPRGFGSLGLAGTGWGCPERSEVALTWHSAELTGLPALRTSLGGREPAHLQGTWGEG